MIYLDEFVAEDMGADAPIGAECPFHFPELRAGWWHGQQAQRDAYLAKVAGRETTQESERIYQ